MKLTRTCPVLAQSASTNHGAAPGSHLGRRHRLTWTADRRRCSAQFGALIERYEDRCEKAALALGLRFVCDEAT